MRYSKAVRNILLGMDNLRLHKLRSLLTMMGIVFGVGSVIAMLSVGEGASREALDQIKKLGSNIIIITSVKPSDDNANDMRRTRMSIYGLLYHDAKRLRETFDTVIRTVPVKLIRKDARVNVRHLEVRLVGTTPDWFSLVRRPLVAGRVLSEQDMKKRKAVAVLTEHGARKLLAVESSLGKPVRIAGDYFEVVGIIRNENIQSGSLSTPDQDADAYVPINVARERFGDMFVKRTSGSYVRELVELHQIIAEVDASENVEKTADGIAEMLKRSHMHDDYRISVPLALLREVERTKRTFNIVLGSIACISLLVGGIGIMNIMLASVTERTKEIGIRRAIGARQKQIVGQFLIETIVLSTAGGLIGICLGLLIPWLITFFAGMPTVVTAWSIVLSLVISVGVGIVFGIYPAFRAAQMDPIIALRHE
ncbi:MAG: ABC transporter permease [Kiritimatiellia bacterium]|jgi:putative ABC transport system permease protein|nr:ABC transporter permease [Kiritimatiellia bacterium]MDP6847159.1 ABC transporter permease [Kiritimatiellia bacterium]